MHLDLGSGDARAPLQWARRRPDWFFVAVDANAEALADSAWRASRKPARGGVSNLVCVAGTAEELACEVPGIAQRITVLLPWGSLLRGVALPEPTLLRALRALCASGAELETVFSYDGRDAIDSAMPALTAAHVQTALPAAYAAAGFAAARVTALAASELRALGTTWAKRLAFGRSRAVWRLGATR